MNLIESIRAEKAKEDAKKPLGVYDKKKYACGVCLRIIYLLLTGFGIYICVVGGVAAVATSIYAYLYTFGGSGTPADIMVAAGGSLFIVFWICVLSFVLVRLAVNKFKDSWKKTEEYFQKIPKKKVS